MLAYLGDPSAAKLRALARKNRQDYGICGTQAAEKTKNICKSTGVGGVGEGDAKQPPLGANGDENLELETADLRSLRKLRRVEVPQPNRERQ